MKLTSYSKEQRLVTDTAPVKVPVCAQSRDRLLARLEPTRRGEDPCLAGGTGSVGRTAREGRDGMNEGHVRKFGREKPLDIDPTRVACGTILRISNVPHQLEMLNISHQGEIRVESKGLQGWGPPRADITAASFSPSKETGERAYLRLSHTSANGTDRAKGAPSTWHVKISDTQ